MRLQRRSQLHIERNQQDRWRHQRDWMRRNAAGIAIMIGGIGGGRRVSCPEAERELARETGTAGRLCGRAALNDARKQCQRDQHCTDEFT